METQATTQEAYPLIQYDGACAALLGKKLSGKKGGGNGK